MKQDICRAPREDQLAERPQALPSHVLNFLKNPMGLLMSAWMFLLSGSASIAVIAAEHPPNFVLIVADDLGWTDLGCFGSSFYETPQLDGLAKNGMRLTAAYSACPVCSPSRVSLMTGRYPQWSGVTDYINVRGNNQPQNWTRNTQLLPAPYQDHLAIEERTLAEALREAGYATFIAGKWHLGGDGFSPEDQGFDVNKGALDWGQPKSYFSPYQNPKLQDGPAGEYLADRLAEETCQFIAAHPARPFFVYLPFYSVHTPLQAPADLVEKYKAKTAAIVPKEPQWGQERTSRVRLVQNHPTFAAMVEAMDTAIGKVLAQLRESGLDDNTVVIFTSDNGGLATAEATPTSNVPLRAGKGWMYEGGIRVPAIVRWPGVTSSGSSNDSPILGIDYFPTILEIAGHPSETADRLDGVSLVPLLRGESLERGPLFWDYPHYGNQGGAPASAVRDGKWKLIEWPEDGALELFDLEADIGETRNVAEKNPEMAARLHHLLSQWRHNISAKSPTPNPNYREDGS